MRAPTVSCPQSARHLVVTPHQGGLFTDATLTMCEETMCEEIMRDVSADSDAGLLKP